VPVPHERQAVADEQEIELAAFARLRDRLEDRKVFAAGRGSRNAPAGNVISCSHSVDAEVHLPARVHSCSSFLTTPFNRAPKPAVLREASTTSCGM
jgi:hypothetical protein